MSMSIDPRQLELVVQFSALLEVLSNPKALDQRVKEVKEVLSEYQRVLGIIKTKEDADVYHKNAQAVLNEANKYLAMERERMGRTHDAAMNDLKRAQQDLSEKLALANGKTITAQKTEEEANLLFDKAKKSFQEASDLLTRNQFQEQELKTLADKLNQKQEKLNQLLG
jgi:predicted NodU family carbamoyl transferase